MNLSDPEHRKVLQESLKDLHWMQAETRQQRDELATLQADLESLRHKDEIDELAYAIKREQLRRSEEAICETLKMIQRQRALIISWLRDRHF
jgi:hypothetical protein